MKFFSQYDSILLSLLVLLVPLSMYVSTLCPTVGLIDSGEMTTVSLTLGVAHPSGYPLYTLFGRLFTLLPLKSVAWRVNLSSALFGALAVLILFRVIRSYTESTIGPLTGSLLFAFSFTHWSIASIAEVYTLTGLFLALLLLIMTIHEKRPSIVPLFFFTLGLSLTNHLVIATAGACAAVYVLTRYRMTRQKLILCCVMLGLGVSLYLYLPIRAEGAPLMNWGDPRTAERLLWHVSGKQYRVWMFSQPLAQVLDKLRSYGSLVLRQYSWFTLWLLVPGFVLLFRTKRWLGVVLVAILALNVGYAVNYNIPDIDPYFIPSFIVLAFVFGFGISYLSRWTKKLTLLFLILPSLLVWQNYRDVDLSKNYLAYDYAANVLRSAEENGIILTNLWDIYSPSLYLRHVEGFRPDLCIVDKELLKRSWYFNYLETEYPWLIEKSQEEVSSYLRLLDDFEHGRPLNPIKIQVHFIAMINSFIQNNLGERPVYVTFFNSHDRDLPSIAPNLARIPVGLLDRLDRTDRYHPFDWDGLVMRGVTDPSLHKDERTMMLISNYPTMMERRSSHLRRLGHVDEAELLLDRAMNIRRDWAAGKSGVRS